MSSKNNPGLYDCYANADPDEEMFVLLARDRHASALVQLWAWMRDKEGEPAEVVEEARAAAEIMAQQARERGKIPLTLDQLLSLAASLKPEAAQVAVATATPAEAFGEPLKEGDVVIAGRGIPAKLTKIFGPDAPERVHGKANILLPRATVPTTVDFSVLRHALPNEVQQYIDQGGRL